MSKLLSKGSVLSMVLVVSGASGCSDDAVDPGTQLVDHSPVGTASSAQDAATQDAAVSAQTDADASTPATTPDAHVTPVTASDAGSSDDHGGDDHDAGDEQHDAGGSSGASDASAPSYPTVVADGTFASVFTVLSFGCVSCHGAGRPLDMSTAETAYATLVNVPASMKACAATDGGVAWTRVVPGDLDNSLMVQKLEGHAPCGSQMPIKLLLPDALVDVVRAWVSAGAPAN